MYRIPIYTVRLVRESSLPAEQPVLSDPAAVARVLWQYLADADREHFVVLPVDSKNRLIGINTVSIGHLNSALVQPREVFKPAALLANAAAVLLGHNHPSTDTTPSREDRALTRRLVKAGKILSIPVLDHLIVGSASQYYSFASHREL